MDTHTHTSFLDKRNFKKLGMCQALRVPGLKNSIMISIDNLALWLLVAIGKKLPGHFYYLFTQVQGTQHARVNADIRIWQFTCCNLFVIF